MEIKIEDWFNIWDNKPHMINLESTKVNVLVGANGTGKTTTLNQIREYAEDYVDFNNEHDGGNTEAQRRLNHGTTSEFASFCTASEGQRIVQSLGSIARQIGVKVKELKGTYKNLYVLLDGIDSGLSIDNIRYIQGFLNTVIKDSFKHKIAVYIIVSANAYELTKEANCIDVKTGKPISFENYEEYAEYVCK